KKDGAAPTRPGLPCWSGVQVVGSGVEAAAASACWHVNYLQFRPHFSGGNPGDQDFRIKQISNLSAHGGEGSMGLRPEQWHPARTGADHVSKRPPHKGTADGR